MREHFSYLDDGQIQEMLSLGELTSLKAGEIFIESGTITHKAGIVISGLMRNYFISDGGEQITAVFASEMQPIAPYYTLFLDRPANVTSEAVEPTLLFVFDFDIFRQRAKTDLAYARVVNDVIQTLFIAAIERIEDFTHKRPEQRYKRLLQTHPDLTDRAPLKHLASYLGITAVSLSRIRKRVSKPKG